MRARRLVTHSIYCEMVYFTRSAEAVKAYPVLSKFSTQTSPKELVKTLTTDEPTHDIEARASSYLASAKKEQEDEERGHAAGPNIGGSARTRCTPDNSETAAFMQCLAGGNAGGDEGTSSAERSRTPHDLSRQGTQNGEDASMENLSDTSDEGFDTQAGDEGPEKVMTDLKITPI